MTQARSRRRFQPRQRAECFHRRNRKIIAQASLGAGAVEHIARQGRHGGEFTQNLSEFGSLYKVSETITSPGLMRASCAGNSPAAHSANLEFRRRHVDPGQPEPVVAVRRFRPRDGEQVIVGVGVEQRVFGQRARRNKAHDAALDDAL